MNHWDVSILIQDAAITVNLDNLILIYGDSGANTVNPVWFRNIHLNISLNLGHNFPIIVRQLSHVFLSHDISGGFYKMGEVSFSSLQ